MTATEGPTVRGQLCDPVLELTGALHGFGQRGSEVPGSTWFARQVHGVRVVRGEDLAGPGRVGEAPVEADAIVSSTPGLVVGVATADCVPILAATRDGRRVAAIHAGWRGLAGGVIEAGLAALEAAPGHLAAAVGPSARACCYEVDAPVAEALMAPYEALLGGVLIPGRPGHFQLDLPALAARILVERAGLARDRIGAVHGLCTICTPGPRFESYRRDGSAAGRMRHFIRPAAARQG